MTINNLRFDGNRLSAQVDSQLVFFEFPSKYRKFIVADYSPFLAAFLLPAMKKGQPLYIEGVVNKKLLNGCYKVMEVVSKWKLGLKPISIEVKSTKQEKLSPKAIATFFSSGVDSFYTLLNRKETTHIICVHGFDISLKNTKIWSSVNKNITSIAKEQKVEYIQVRTNLREVLDSYLPWGISHGGALASVGLCLRKLFKKVYISSSYYHEDLFPWGSHPDIDPKWSTNQLEFIHFGSNKRRTQKVASIAFSNSTMRHLRVCWMNTAGKYNCGKCEKCIRTMINLLLVDRLKSSQTFPHIIHLDDVRKIVFHNEHEDLYFKENLSALKKSRKHAQLVEAMESVYQKLQNPPLTVKLRSLLRQIDSRYFSNKIFSSYIRLIQSK